MWVMMVVIACGATLGVQTSWVCPDIQNVSCSCDFPHTLRCTGNETSLDLIAASLRSLPSSRMVSLLDCSIQGLVHINEPILKGVSLHGLVISSGVLTRVSENAFDGIRSPLEALGFPNNQLAYVPILALSRLTLLTRLDLSHNRLQSLSSHSFQSLFNLRFLDLSWNRLSNISNKAFTDLTRLKTLRLQSNNINGNVLSKLQGLLELEELDISNNRLSGPLTPSSFPRLPNLLTLNVAGNQINSIVSGALTGFDSLETLNLERNMIDVLEDHAFKALSTLNTLNLAHNRIIAFSESSFAHLVNLTTLDLSNNFLRALSRDLLNPLTNLRELKLDGNEISMVFSDALEGAHNLKMLTMTDNPLNCDCSLQGFVEWLNKTDSKQKERINAVCAIPPSLENAYVLELPIDQFVCDQDDTRIDAGSIPVSGTLVMLQGFDYNGTHISLLWLLDADVPYRCGELFIYEELGSHQVLLETKSLNCNSTTLENPHFLTISHDVSQMETGSKYRYCITMVELRPKKHDVPKSLALGCSGIMALKEVYPPKIASFQAVNSALSFIEIHADAWPHSARCKGNITVYLDSKFVHRSPFYCGLSKYNISGLPMYGPYNVCISLQEIEPECISVAAQYILPHPYASFVTLIFSVMFFVLLLIVISAYKYFHRISHPPKLHEQCFLPARNDENQSSGYMKLQATSKV